MTRIATPSHAALPWPNPASKGRVGLFSIGLAAYWPQFPGLKERLEGYGRRVTDRVAAWADVVWADDADAARAVGDTFARERVDLILLHGATHACAGRLAYLRQIKPAYSIDTTAAWLGKRGRRRASPGWSSRGGAMVWDRRLVSPAAWRHISPSPHHSKRGAHLCHYRPPTVATQSRGIAAPVPP